MSHIFRRYIIIEGVAESLNQLDLADSERVHLASLLDETFDNAILDEVLSSLTADDKKIFLQNFSQDPQNEEMIDFLQKRIKNFDQRIKGVMEDLTNLIYEDIKKAKKEFRI